MSQDNQENIQEPLLGSVRQTRSALLVATATLSIHTIWLFDKVCLDSEHINNLYVLIPLSGLEMDVQYSFWIFAFSVLYFWIAFGFSLRYQEAEGATRNRLQDLKKQINLCKNNFSTEIPSFSSKISLKPKDAFKEPFLELKHAASSMYDLNSFYSDLFLFVEKYKKLTTTSSTEIFDGHALSKVRELADSLENASKSSYKKSEEYRIKLTKTIEKIEEKTSMIENTLTKGIKATEFEINKSSDILKLYRDKTQNIESMLSQISTDIETIVRDHQKWNNRHIKIIQKGIPTYAVPVIWIACLLISVKILYL